MATLRPLGLVMLALTLPTSACVTMPDADARYAAGWRPGRGYCLFGGEAPRLAAWCADVNFGQEGLMIIALAVNTEILERAAGGSLACTEHVASARRAMADYPDYALTEVYSCDAEPEREAGHPVCHVSLLVTSLSGARVVLDNGRVLDPDTTGGVAAYAQFARRVDRHWVGRRPDGVEVAVSGGTRR